MPPLPEQLLSLTPATLRALLSTFAPTRPLPPKASPFALARALFLSPTPLPAKLSSALSGAVARFSSRSGRLAFVEAARASGDRRADDWLALPAADAAALLAIERATATGRARRAASRLFALASHRVERDLPERHTYELVADAPVARDPAAVLRLLRRALGERLLDAWPTTDADGASSLALFVRQPTEIRLVAEDDGSVAQRRDVPVAVDLVRVSATGDRVAITTAMDELLPEYASALGLSLRPSFTLRPLQDLTRAQLAGLAVPRVSRIDVVALRFRRSDGARIEVRATDALDPSLDVPRTGYIDRATIRVTIDGTRTVDAFLQLPHRLEISDRAFEAPVRAALAALGLFAPGALPDDARSLAPYVHGDWRWRAVLTDAGFEALAKEGRLVRAVASHVATHEHRMHGAAYVVRDVPGEPEVQYALAEDRSLGARLVGQKDREAWRLDLARLADGMRTDLGAVAVDRAGALVIDGVLDLGIVTLPSGRLRFVYAMAAPPKGWMATARRACGLGVTLVVLVPRGHGTSDGALEIELDVAEQLGLARIGRVLGRAAEALGAEAEVDGWRRRDEDVVVDLESQRAWVSGVLVALSVLTWRFLEHMAKNVDRVSSTKEIGAYISSSDYPDVAARRAKAELERQVRGSLEARGVDAGIVERMIVAEGKRGYRFGVAVGVIGGTSPSDPR